MKYAMHFVLTTGQGYQYDLGLYGFDTGLELQIMLMNIARQVWGFNMPFNFIRKRKRYEGVRNVYGETIRAIPYEDGN